MMPVYRPMNSYPHQMSHPGYYCPGYINNPHQIRMNTPMSGSCEYWPYSSSSGYASMPCYGCCIHGNFPDYNGVGPYYLPQVPYHPCCGVHHAPPYYIPPRCPVDRLPRFEYDKDMARNRHCSGCSEHVWDARNGNRIRIEEQEPGIQKDSGSKAVVSAQSPDFPYPIIWLPHESVRSQEHRGSVGSENQTPAEAKAPENTKVVERNGGSPSLIQNQDRNNMETGQKLVFPFDIEKLKSLSQGQDGVQNPRNVNGMSDQFPYPVFWIPFQGKSHEEKEDMPILKLFPCNLQANGDVSGKSEDKEDCSKSNVRSETNEKHAHQTIIPAKQSEDQVYNFQEPEPKSKEQNTQQKTIPVKQSEEDQGKKSSDQANKGSENKPGESTVKKQSISPSKASKLPPVCLRVDPLPKKRNGNGSSRSPSPPTRKGESSGTVEDSSKLSTSTISKKEEPDKSGTRTVTVMGDEKCEEAGKGRTMSETGPMITGTVKETTESEANPEEAKKIQSRPDNAEERKKSVKKTFSDEEAATVIQSGYRGYEVRRWEPLKKLKQMAKIREQILDVKNRIQAAEDSSEHRSNEKEITVVGEMVMNLLLKLDAIQGLHASIRDIRKSLAKELLGLQEKLDSLKNSRAMVEDVSVAKQVETPGEAMDEKTSEDVVDSGQGQGQYVQEHKLSELSSEESDVPVMSTTNGVKEELTVAEEDTQSAEISMQCKEESVRCDSAATKAIISAAEEESESSAKSVASTYLQAADGKDTTVNTCDCVKEDAAMESLELMKELPQFVEEAELQMAQACRSLPLEDNAELLELPIGLIDEEKEDLSHPMAQESLPCTQDTDSTEPMMTVNDMAPNTEVDHQKENYTSDTIEVTKDDDGDDSGRVEYLKEMPSLERTDEPTMENKDTDQLADNLESIERNEKEAEESNSVTADENAIVDAATSKIQVETIETGESPSTETTIREDKTLERNKKLMEENQRLRETMEKLMEAGREQLDVISSLTGRVKTLEKKLSRRKKLQGGRGRLIRNASRRRKAPASSENNVRE